MSLSSLDLTQRSFWTMKEPVWCEANTPICAAGADLVCGRHVTGLFCRGASWEVQTKLGDSERFDAVVLTMPVPQILQLQGDVGSGETDAAKSHHMCVGHVTWSHD